MNSEELEVSLRAEFESYLKNVFAETRQEISQLQTKIEAEIENHKSHLNAVFTDALARAESDREFDAGFNESVVEHLRLARDEGARITATAIAEAEAMEKEAAPKAGIKELHEAVNDISGKNSQAEILKTLVQHASAFAPRGAFFIIKNEHFVGWRTFGSEGDAGEEAVREIFLPVSADSILSEAVRSLATVESSAETYRDDAAILSKLDFGSPEKIYAIPLVARGRGVAVLYTDYGTKGETVNVEALETMVRVAGLTVEVLASGRGTSTKKKSAESPHADRETAPSYQTPEPAETTSEYAYQPSFQKSETFEKSESEIASFVGGSYNQTPHAAEEQPQNSSANDYAVETVSDETTTHDYSDGKAAEEKYPAYEDSDWNQPAETSAAQTENYQIETHAPETENQTVYEQSSWNDSADAVPSISAQEYAENFAKESDPTATAPDYSFQPTAEEDSSAHQNYSANSGSVYQYEAPKTEQSETFSMPPETYAPVKETDSFSAYNEKPQSSFVPAVETAPAPSAPVKSRLSERNVDLPIEVSEDERRLHNDARRFARLLVSEIKLYNEQKVKEGRDASDLYDRLREAVDRSREMYDKRVQPPVAAKFDYFHYELVNTLAEGDADKLGTDYPGSSV